MGRDPFFVEELILYISKRLVCHRVRVRLWLQESLESGPFSRFTVEDTESHAEQMAGPTGHVSQRWQHLRERTQGPRVRPQGLGALPQRLSGELECKRGDG